MKRARSDTTYHGDPTIFGNSHNAEFVRTSMAIEETHTMSCCTQSWVSQVIKLVIAEYLFPL